MSGVGDYYKCGGATTPTRALGFGTLDEEEVEGAKLYASLYRADRGDKLIASSQGQWTAALHEVLTRVAATGGCHLEWRHLGVVFMLRLRCICAQYPSADVERLEGFLHFHDEMISTFQR